MANQMRLYSISQNKILILYFEMSYKYYKNLIIREASKFFSKFKALFEKEFFTKNFYVFHEQIFQSLFYLIYIYIYIYIYIKL